MKIIPAIDLIDGQAVRLEQGQFSKKKIYHSDPLELAKSFEAAGEGKTQGRKGRGTPVREGSQHLCVLSQDTLGKPRQHVGTRRTLQGRRLRYTTCRFAACVLGSEEMLCAMLETEEMPQETHSTPPRSIPGAAT